MNPSTASRHSNVTLCPACGSRAFPGGWPTDRIRGRKRIVWCASCGLGWQHPLPEREEIRSRFNNAVYMIQSESEKTKGFTRRIERLNQLAPQHGKLLDIGCGFGHFMHLAQEAGWHVHGIEPHKAAVEHCRSHYGFDVEMNVMENRCFRAGRFDAVTLWDVWEHVYDPIVFMDQCIDMLASGGILAVAIPNASGWPARIFKGRWRYVMITHLNYFKMDFVDRLMKKRQMRCIQADHTFKLHSLLEGLLALLHIRLNMEKIMRWGRRGGLESGPSLPDPGLRYTRTISKRIGVTHRLRQMALVFNLARMTFPIGDMVDLYFCKTKD